MNNDINQNLKKKLGFIFLLIFAVGMAVLFYYKSIYLPEKEKQYIIEHTPALIENRASFSEEEDDEMKAVYEEIMKKKAMEKAATLKMSTTTPLRRDFNPKEEVYSTKKQ